MLCKVLCAELEGTWQAWQDDSRNFLRSEESLQTARLVEAAMKGQPESLAEPLGLMLDLMKKCTAPL